MKPELYLITNDFPFGEGENSFILPELPYLAEKFNVTIISNSFSDNQTCFLDRDIKVIHYDRKAWIFQKLYDCASYFGKTVSYKEILEILKSGEKIIGRLFESILFFGEARRFERFIYKSHTIGEGKPIIIYCYWFTYYCLAMLKYKERHANVKVITRAHRYDLYDEGCLFGRQPFKKEMNRNIDSIVFIAEHGRQYYKNKYGVLRGEEQYQLFRLGVRPLSKPLTIKGRKKEFLLVSCAQVIPRKRVELIVDALAQITDFQIKWIHFGDGSGYVKLCQYADEKLRYMKNIKYELTGYIVSEKILEFYGENYVDCFITTTSSEGCPVSVQEAMSYGIPVIGTAVAEIPYMIKRNGVLLSENPSASEVADGIRSIYNQSMDSITILRKNSYQLWKENFNSEKNSREFTDFLRKLVEDVQFS